MKKSLFCGTFLSILLCLQQVASAEPFDYGKLRAEYFRLKNIDPQISEADKWQQVLTDYEAAQSNKLARLADQFYLDYSGLLMELGRARNDPALFEKSIDAADDLINKFPDSKLADDAMLKKSELLKLSGASAELVAEELKALIAKYPSSDAAQVATIKLSNPGSSKQAKLPEEQLLNLPIVVLDPGHGGEDFGAQSDLGLLEKDVTLSIALTVEKLLISQKIARPVLTRRADIFVPLKQRVELANANKAALFISIHSNASPEKNQSGLTTYILDDSSDESSRLLAERENKSAGDMTDLQFILGDLIQSSKHPKSILLAESLERQLLSASTGSMKQVKNNKIKKAPFFVLVGAQMPCVLLELFFIDQQKDAEFLSDPDFRQDLAQGISSGIKIFLEKQ